ncbi:hypothetical protein [Adhaeribacter soli]|uniref:Uncharacterized protein n=1 Tax=Adhaeribacter soli TaxID=2607655 RepID=A0A5N1J364_9BACT|nr:hypothetical protein [Adhaeribacter soli]KAA9340206.1 hypothetical protein F0P94_07615 [Adhaeribacter soli]
MDDLVKRLNKIESSFEELNSEIEIQIKGKLSNYYAKPFFLKFFSKEKRIENAFNEWIKVKSDIHLIMKAPNRVSELPGILNLYALNSAILAAILDNPGLAQKAEQIRIISEGSRNYSF